MVPDPRPRHGAALRHLTFACAALWSAGASLPATSARAEAPLAGEPVGYRALIDEALAEYEAHNFAEARSLFYRANALYPNARALRGLGMAEFELRNYSDSASSLQLALQSATLPLEGELRAETERLLARARGFVAKLSLALEPGLATVVVDGTPVQLGPQGSLVLEVGDHVLEFRADGYAAERRVLKVQGGEEQTLRVVLPVRQLPPGAPAQSAPTPAEPASAASARHRVAYFLPRFTLSVPMPGTAKLKYECSGPDDCPDDGSQDYLRNAGAMLGAEVSFAVGAAWRLGLGFDVQLNHTTGTADDNDQKAEYGRLFWLPATLEYRLAVGSKLTLPLRLLTGLALMKASGDFERSSKALRQDCDELNDSGTYCSVSGPPGVGVVVGAGPGAVVALGKLALRVDLTFGYQWLRLTRWEESWDDGFHLDERQIDGSFITALSLGLEL